MKVFVHNALLLALEISLRHLFPQSPRHSHTKKEFHSIRVRLEGTHINEKKIKRKKNIYNDIFFCLMKEEMKEKLTFKKIKLFFLFTLPPI